MNSQETRKYIIKIGIYLIILICSVISAVAILQNISVKLEESQENVKTEIKESKISEVSLYLDDMISAANLEAKLHAVYLEHDLIKEYSQSMHELLMDLSKAPSAKLNDIFKKNVDGNYFGNIENHDNELIIANYHGILYDHDYRNTINDSIYRSWGDELKSHNNSVLYDHTINSILSQDASTYLAVSTNKTSSLNEYKSINKDTIREILLENDISLLKDIVYYSVAYIYDDSDILGNDDIQNGKKVENCKIMVIQKFNLYQQLEKRHPEIISELTNSKISNALDSMMRSYRFLQILLILDFIILIVIACLIYNLTMDFIRTNDIGGKL